LKLIPTICWIDYFSNAIRLGMDDFKPKKTLTPAGMFYRRRDDWIKHVLKRPKADLSHVEKLVAIYIAETINPDTRRWVTSQEKIAIDMEIGVRVVKSAVAKLKEAGLLEAKRTKVNGNPKTFNCYSIVAVDDALPRANVRVDALS
jgi:hypothetical protein